MPKLRELFDKINDSRYSRYSEDAEYPIQVDGQITHLRALELLEVGRTHPSREHVMIAYFGDESTRVLYFGDDALSMRKTLADLKLPNSWPSNLGEKVFYRFKGHLEDTSYSGPISLEQQVVSGKEHQFGLVLRKFVEIYRTQDEQKLDFLLRELLDVYLAYQEQDTLKKRLDICQDENEKKTLTKLLEVYNAQDSEKLKSVLRRLIIEIHPFFDPQEILKRFQQVLRKYLDNFQGGNELKVLLELCQVRDNEKIDFLLEKIMGLSSYAAENDTLSGEMFN